MNVCDNHYEKLIEMLAKRFQIMFASRLTRQLFNILSEGIVSGCNY